MKNNIIDEIYNENNFPGLEKLFKLVKSDHPKITKNEIKEFIDTLKHISDTLNLKNN